MKNVKELARMLTDGIRYENAELEDDNILKPVDEQIEEQNKRFDLVFWELMDEFTDLMKRQNRPIKSALKQITDKSDSMLFRANKIAGGNVFSNNLFIIQFVITHNDEEDGRKKLLQYFNSPKELKRVCEAVESSEPYLKLVQEQKEQERMEEAAKNFHPYPVTPYDELIAHPDLIMMEILNSFAAIGNYHRVGFTVEMMMPLIQRTQFLDLSYKLYKKITKELVEEFEADRLGTIQRLYNLYHESGGDNVAK